MLFSEPKIPQLSVHARLHCPRGRFQCSSASRKFLNAAGGAQSGVRDDLFQCSSASRKFLNAFRHLALSSEIKSFSALQRAENSSMPQTLRRAVQIGEFQCSSASRKFLNVPSFGAVKRDKEFQCSSASRKFLNSTNLPKPRASPAVSVLFSEPKIPQSDSNGQPYWERRMFQCSSASRKFLNLPI